MVLNVLVKKNCKRHYNESIKSTKVKFLGSMIVTFTVLVVTNKL